MTNLSRRSFLQAASAAMIATSTSRSFGSTPRQRVFIGSNTPQGILSYDWDAATGELTRVGQAAKLDNVDWITFSPDRKTIFAASEVDNFNGEPGGGVVSYAVQNGSLKQISARNSAAKGTCHVAIDAFGRVLLSADYGGGSAAAFKVNNGELSPHFWTEHYKGSGPVADRQEAAHAHFASFSPDNRFAYINDLGSDCIHIYALNAQAGQLKPAGRHNAKPGSGPRTLHFHPNGSTAYCMNEINSTVDVLKWNKDNGNFALITTIDLKPDRSKPKSTGCDTVITKDGRHVYFANRGDDFIATYKADPSTGALTYVARVPSGGKTPRNFTLDPTERWMLVANQGSDQLCVFARDPQTGTLASEHKSFAAPAPMCILFA